MCLCRRRILSPRSRDMSEGVATDHQDTELERVERWRRQVLIESGYDRKSARTLAICADVDLHVAVQLLRAGCPARVAVRILL
jgi:hypothetical protein